MKFLWKNRQFFDRQLAGRIQLSSSDIWTFDPLHRAIIVHLSKASQSGTTAGKKAMDHSGQITVWWDAFVAHEAPGKQRL
eukprot:g77855.t1